MRNAKRALFVTMATLAACGDDGTSTSSSSSGATSSGGSSSGGSSSGGSSSGGSSGASSGSSGAQAGATCGPDAGACASGLVCCAPRPELEGVCQSNPCELDSDRDIKEDFAHVDRASVLEKLASLGIEEWSYMRDRGAGVRHVGPMAQDFRRAFGLGASDRHIHAVDAHGVTIAALQAMYERVVSLEAEVASLRREKAQRTKASRRVAAKKPRLT